MTTTGFYENMAADRLPLAMKLEADRMAISSSPTLSSCRSARSSSKSGAPGSTTRRMALLDEQIDAALYLKSAFTSDIGWESEMHQLHRRRMPIAF